MDIVITLPAKTEWEEYQKELDYVSNWTSDLLFKVPNIPRKAELGDRCYLLWRGYVRGWIQIVGFKKNYLFTCLVTGKRWKGNFIVRSGPFHRLNNPIPMKGFQGFRYEKD